jgi:aryl-alcohol dehydrogenase-like predicted oxidoreductase
MSCIFQEREQFVIATKCGIILEGGSMRYDGSRAHVRSACEASIKRLGIDCIDLYYLHSESKTIQQLVTVTQAVHVPQLYMPDSCTWHGM